MIEAYVPYRLVGYGIALVIVWIVVMVNKARAATAKVDPSSFVPELTTIRRDLVPAMPVPLETVATAVGQLTNVRLEGVTDSVYVALNAAGGLFVRLTPTQVAGGTKLVVDGRRKVKVGSLGDAEDAMLAFEASLRRQLAAMGHTVGALPAGAPATPAPATPAPIPATAAPAVAQSAVTPPAFAPPVAATPAPLTLVLRFDDGAVRQIANAALIGRDPARDERDTDMELVAIVDPSLSVSKTHFAVGIDASGVWVEDRHSTNGLTVIEPDGSSLKVLIGRQVRVMPGSRVNFGDRWLTVGP